MLKGKFPHPVAIGLLFALVIPVSTTMVLAQETESPAADSEAETQDTAPDQSTVEPPEKEQSDRSPFDYKSSERISEDSSVSFPVDI